MKYLTKPLAFLLIFALLASTGALASDALGSRLYAYTLDICDQTTLTREVMWSASKSDLRTENYVTYTPNASVSPAVSYGTSVLSKQSVYTMAKSLESSGRRVLSGINGDYFVMATGDPLGIVVTDGVLRSSASYLSALGFRADGSAVIGKPDLTMTASLLGYDLKIAGINKVRTASGFYIFTDDFGSTTQNTLAGVDVILAPNTAGEELTIGGTVSCTVEEVIEATGATAIPQGKFVLSISNKAGEWLQETIRSLKAGDTVDISLSSADTRWNEVESAVGAMYWILKDGVVDTSLSDGSSAPRTAVGVKADGSVIFYTIDGRQSGLSIGATIQMTAQRLKELGCENAVLLDGGGSTTLVSTYPDYGQSSIINSPSEGTPRSVSNAVFLLSNLSATGTAGSLYVTPTSLTLMPGASTQCVAKAVDTGWWPMDALPGAVTWSAAEGSVSDSGVFTAPASPGVYTVSAESGGVTGSTEITVLQPDAISVKNQSTGKSVSSLSLSPGQTVNLTAGASYKALDLTGSDSCFTWTADSDIGTITADGTFTAGQSTASGKIKVASGSCAVTISVSVSAPAKHTLLADFENAAGLTGENAALSLDGSQVKYGRQSLKVGYRTGAVLSLPAPRTLGEAETYVSLWVYGDGSGSILSGDFSYADGTPVTQALATLNFSGWKQVSAPVPEGAVTFDGLSVTCTGSGTLYLDQLVLANDPAWDTTAPTVSLTVSGSSVTAKISDNNKTALAADRLRLTLDGEEVSFQWDGSSVLTATLSNLGTASHQVTVTACDPCGNLARDSVTIAGTAASPFTDMTAHWARTYTTRLQEKGILSGVSSTLFQPNSSITRGDFALMTAHWLGLDLTDYDDVTLPYTDASSIPSWDLAAVKALYAEGIMTGSKTSGGSLRANAKASITRAEAMTVLGRLLEKGYSGASLSAFSDAASVQSWAKDYVAILVNLDVVSGSGGQLRPKASITRAEAAKLLFTMW